MANWDQRGHDYDYSDNRFLAPDPPSGRRPLSTRSPHSNDGRGLSRIRRPSFHRDYHSDNEAMMSERLSERDPRDMQYVDPEYVYVGQPVLIASKKRVPSPPPGNIWQSSSRPRSHSRHASSGASHDQWEKESVESQLLQLESGDSNAKRLAWAKQEQDRLAASHAQSEHKITIDVGPSKRGRSRNSISRKVVPPRAPMPGSHRRAIESDSEDSDDSDVVLKKPDMYPRYEDRHVRPQPDLLPYKRSPTSPTNYSSNFNQIPSPPPFGRHGRFEQPARNTSPHTQQPSYGQYTTTGKLTTRRKSLKKDREPDTSTIPGAFPSGPGTVEPDDPRLESSMFRRNRQSLPALPHRSIPPPPAHTGTLGSKAFQYSLLHENEFRLLRILPARMSTIKCELMHLPMSKPPPYRAISYAWGDAGDTRSITLEGTNTLITVSLYGALEALREKKDAVLVWADFLCIDQQNSAEKSQQLQLMPSIYSKAEAVAIWLGPQTDNSELAVRLLDEIAAIAEYPDRITSLIKTRAATKDFAAVVSLFERDYWRRLWVVQEVLNARDIWVFTGGSTLHWSVYKTASQVFWRHKNDLAYYFPAVSSGARGQGISPNQFSFSQALVYQGPKSLPELKSLTALGEESLLHVMRALRRKTCSDPRDKVFGILGILSPYTRSEFPVDLSLSVKEVYINVVDYLLSTTESLDVICESIHFPLHTNSADLPSWVPDWSHSPETAALGSWYNFSASGDEKAKYRFVDERRNKLEISAIYVDTIATHGIAVGTLCTLADYLMAFLHWRALLFGSGAAEDEYAEDDFCRTLCLDQIPIGDEWNAHSWQVTCYHVFASLLEERLPYLKLDRQLRLCKDAKGISIKPEERRAFLQTHFGSRMMGRCFFLTEEGVMGMGSGFMTAGDVVVVPLGCSTPIILRLEGNKGEYRYVGDTYLDGYMQEEAVKAWKSGKNTLAKYVLH